MNIVSFDIEIVKKLDQLNDPIIEIIRSRYRGNSTAPLTYSEDVLNKWNGLNYKTLKGLYDPQQIIVSGNTKGIDYFLVVSDLQNLYNQNDITLQVLLVGRSNKVSLTLNHVIANIREILIGLKANPVLQNPVSLFPFNSEENDIYNYIRVNGEFKHVSLSRGEWITYISFFVAACILTAIHIFSNNLSEGQKATLIGFYVAGYIFVASEIIFKLLIPLYFQKNKYIIEISDLANPIEKNYHLPFGGNDEIAKLKTPKANG